MTHQEHKQQHAHHQHNTHKTPKKNNTFGLIITIIAIILVAGIALSYYNNRWNRFTARNLYVPNGTTSCAIGNTNGGGGCGGGNSCGGGGCGGGSCGGGGGGCGGSKTSTTAPVIPTTVSSTNSEAISVDYTDNEIVPAVINLQAGKKYTITMTMNHDPRGCMNTILLQGLDERVQPVQRGTTLTFNVDATTPGTYRFVCGSMGMSHGAQVVIQ